MTNSANKTLQICVSEVVVMGLPAIIYKAVAKVVYGFIREILTPVFKMSVNLLSLPPTFGIHQISRPKLLVQARSFLFNFA